MKNTTLSFYENHALQFYHDTINVDMTDIYQPFLHNLPKDALHILDVGCGSGRDSRYFGDLGYYVTAIDGSQNLIDLAKNANTPHIDWLCLNFDEIYQQAWQGKFSGIWACASLLHIPFDHLVNLINTLLNLLIENGIIYLSFKYGDQDRLKDGRYFCDMNDKRWSDINNHLNAQTIKTWITRDNRKDRSEQWFNAILKKV
ncbi:MULTISPECIES: class I SAM-dependent methyltransferase [Moraxella]|uniref:Tellurite resistance protein-related protein n=1 Tax=Moraxella catarrhalis TaxID=480 RepID=A0A7Z0V0E0_MORCA|nr:class I SAM-dependent methyltransferase [Moraxella catarrhalis]OAV02082.1 Tellurite resistance protein-related protein [Moraxella catarrhalis]STY82017.1 Mg-protoporphyrin IX methyl transferase [Moraxella catarrhalis]